MDQKRCIPVIGEASYPTQDRNDLVRAREDMMMLIEITRVEGTIERWHACAMLPVVVLN